MKTHSQEHKELNLSIFTEIKYKEYSVFVLQENINPGNFLDITYKKTNISIDKNMCFNSKNSIEYITFPVSPICVRYYFPVGGKKGSYFFSLKNDFYENKINNND